MVCWVFIQIIFMHICTIYKQTLQMLMGVSTELGIEIKGRTGSSSQLEKELNDPEIDFFVSCFGILFIVLTH